MGKEYWFCTIGPVDRSKVPDGGDAPLRGAVQDVFENMTNTHAYACASGWGITEEQNEAMYHARLNPEEQIAILNEMKDRVSYLSNLCVRAVAEGWTVAQVTKALKTPITKR